MALLNFTSEHNDYRKRLNLFLEKEVIPHSEKWEKDHIVPKDIWRKMGKAGFLCPTVPKDYGGMGYDFLYSVIVAEELARSNQCGLIPSLHSDIVVPYIVSYGSEEIKKKYLPGCISGDIITAVAMTEPGAGSDLSSISTTAVEEDDCIVINGTKTFISNGINCDLVIVAAKDPEINDPYNSLSLYIVENGTSGFEKGRHLEKMGLHSQDTSELFFSKCKIPKENILGTKGMGFIMLMEKLQQERLITALLAVFACQQMIDWTIDYCKKTKKSGKPLSKFQAAQFSIIEMLTEIKMAKAFVDQLVYDHMQKKQIVAETSMAKYKTTDLAKQIASQCLDLLGDFGIVEKCVIVRAFRDVRIMSIFAGTNEIMKQIAAKFIGL